MCNLCVYVVMVNVCKTRISFEVLPRDGQYCDWRKRITPGLPLTFPLCTNGFLYLLTLCPGSWSLLKREERAWYVSSHVQHETVWVLATVTRSEVREHVSACPRTIESHLPCTYLPLMSHTRYCTRRSPSLAGSRAWE